MLLAFFMNAAIDQQCEKYIRENGLEHLVEAKLKEKMMIRGCRGRGTIRRARHCPDQAYQGEMLPEGNDGLGLLLLGLTGDEVLPKDVYEK
jgi:methylmalonyl-CoA mutase